MVKIYVVPEIAYKPARSKDQAAKSTDQFLQHDLHCAVLSKGRPDQSSSCRLRKKV